MSVKITVQRNITVKCIGNSVAKQCKITSKILLLFKPYPLLYLAVILANVSYTRTNITHQAHIQEHPKDVKLLSVVCVYRSRSHEVQGHNVYIIKKVLSPGST